MENLLSCHLPTGLLQIAMDNEGVSPASQSRVEPNLGPHKTQLQAVPCEEEKRQEAGSTQPWLATENQVQISALGSWTR